MEPYRSIMDFYQLPIFYDLYIWCNLFFARALGMLRFLIFLYSFEYSLICMYNLYH